MKVLYHANCYDGFCAAWLARKQYPDAEFMPIQYGKSQSDFIEDIKNYENEDLLIVDFSFKRPHMEKLLKLSSSVTCLDHHKSAKEELKDLKLRDQDTIVFDMDKSGARLTQEHLNLPDHWLVNYTEDHDLWRFNLPQSKIIKAGLKMYEFDFDIWNHLLVHEVLQTGEIILKYNEKLTKGAIERAVPIDIAGHMVLTTNLTHSDIISDVAGQLCDGNETYSGPFNFGSTYFHSQEGFTFSLRSRGDFDVSEIAKSFGGGGHHNAAGFNVEIFFK